MFEEIITSKEVKFNNLEKKVYKFVCFFGCLIIKLMLEAYDRKLMENRDKKKYRHKGLRETSVNTVMGEIKYKRVMYEIQEEGITKTVYLLDETLKISVEGKVSSNLVEKVIETVPVTDSYRKAEEVIDATTNTSLCHEKIRGIILKIGDKITNKEKEERKLFDKNQLVAGLKEVTALFEEADGLWINLQGKDRKEKLEKNKQKAERENKEFVTVSSEEELRNKFPAPTSKLILLCKKLMKEIGKPNESSGIIWQFNAMQYLSSNPAFTKDLVAAFRHINKEEREFINSNYLEFLEKIASNLYC